MSFNHLTVQQTGWGYLLGFNGRKVGEPYTYGRCDKDSGEPLLYLIEGLRNGRPIISRDYDAGLVYPDALFIWGSGEDNRTPLSHEQLYAYLQELKVRTGKDVWEPVRIHRGFAGGVATWYHALKSETNIGPRYYEVERQLQPFHEKWNHYSPFPNRAELVIPIE